IPMQFFILLTGVLVFVFYLFNTAPVHWNSANVEAMRSEDQVIRRSDDANTNLPLASDSVDPLGRPNWLAGNFALMQAQNGAAIQQEAQQWVAYQRAGDGIEAEQRLSALKQGLKSDIMLREDYRAEIKAINPAADTNDKDYIFITFIMDHMPIGIIGLLLAMIFSAGMSSTSAELSALATTSVVDVVKKERTDGEQVRTTKWATVAFGLLALAFAALFPLFENLIQAVNIIGSLFYGTILGVFLVAFFMKRVDGTAVFIAAVITQAFTLLHFALDKLDAFATVMPDGTMRDPLELAFLWYNLIAPAIVVGISAGYQMVTGK
ncbi:MAG TPA: hypothetical protein PKJ19_11280, partial [Flavobacteriales bacterium]|nr:hypothetical protein [Flavobacteriales bacterium]